MENDPGKSPQVQLEVKTCVSRHSCCAQGAGRTFQPLWSRLRKVTKARWRMKPLGPRTDPEPRQRMEPLPGPGLQSSGTVSCSFGSSLSVDPIPSETPGTVPALPRGVSAGRALLPPPRATPPVQPPPGPPHSSHTAAVTNASEHRASEPYPPPATKSTRPAWAGRMRRVGTGYPSSCHAEMKKTTSRDGGDTRATRQPSCLALGDAPGPAGLPEPGANPSPLEHPPSESSRRRTPNDAVMHWGPRPLLWLWRQTASLRTPALARRSGVALGTLRNLSAGQSSRLRDGGWWCPLLRGVVSIQ